jgi:hypothetical protein
MTNPDPSPRPRLSPGMMLFAPSVGVLLVLAGFLAFSVLVLGTVPDKWIFLGLCFSGLMILNILIGFFLEIVWSIRHRTFGGLAVQLGVFALLGVGYWLFSLFWFGVAVDGDVLATLLGKPRQDPEVERVFKQLGYDHAESDKEASWSNHSVKFLFSTEGNIRMILIGTQITPYPGKLPYGLELGQDQDVAAQKLGVAPRTIRTKETDSGAAWPWSIPEKRMRIWISHNRVRNVDLE